MCSVSLENKGDEPLGIIDFLMRRYDRLRLYDRIQFVPVTAFYRVKYRKMRALQIARKLAVFPSYYEDAYPVKEGRLAPKFALGRWKDQALSRATPYPLQAWTRKWINRTACTHNPNQGSFSVSTRDALQRSRAFYEDLRRQFASCTHCEAVHFVERVWPYVFASRRNGKHVFKCMQNGGNASNKADVRESDVSLVGGVQT